MMRAVLSIALFTLATGSALAADDRFYKPTPDSKMGFLAATDPLYVKECGSCHFPYSPGLLPARSWILQLDRMGKHFGETVTLSPATRESLQQYLTTNAADVSPYEGSHVFMERIEPGETPYRLRDVFLFRHMHAVIVQVMAMKPTVQVRKITNCNACHRGADRGSFGNAELFIPGLTRDRDVNKIGR